MPQTHAEYLTGRIEYYEGKIASAKKQQDKASRECHYVEYHAMVSDGKRFSTALSELQSALDHYNTSITPEQSPHESVCGC